FPLLVTLSHLVDPRENHPNGSTAQSSSLKELVRTIRNLLLEEATKLEKYLQELQNSIFTNVVHPYNPTGDCKREAPHGDPIQVIEHGDAKTKSSTRSVVPKVGKLNRCKQSAKEHSGSVSRHQTPDTSSTSPRSTLSATSCKLESEFKRIRRAFGERKLVGTACCQGKVNPMCQGPFKEVVTPSWFQEGKEFIPKLRRQAVADVASTKHYNYHNC
ncbi:hypothetical protein AHF37_07233, partial [Paragonimus kellicotti]